MFWLVSETWRNICTSTYIISTDTNIIIFSISMMPVKNKQTRWPLKTYLKLWLTNNEQYCSKDSTDAAGAAITGIPRLTQPSTLRGTVKWVSALGLSNNKMAMVDVDGSCLSFGGLTVQVCWLGLGVGGHLGAESAFIKWTGWTLAMACHDDSTINIDLVIIIIIILHSRTA